MSAEVIVAGGVPILCAEPGASLGVATLSKRS